MRKEIGTVIVKMLENLGIPSFIAGSTRLGINISTSDVDVYAFVLYNHNDQKSRENPKIFCDVLTSLGFVGQKGRDAEDVYRWGNIEIVEYRNREKFEKENEFYNLVEHFLNENPLYRDVAYDMKLDGIEGQKIFKYLIKIASFHKV